MSKAISEMDYSELQAAAKAAGVPANGTKEDLVARLEGLSTPAEPTPATPTEPAAPAPAEPTEPTEPPAPAAPAAEPETSNDREVEKAWRGDAAKMKEHLDKQPKVSIMIPLELGVSPEQAEKIPFVVNMNGYRFQIKRGTFVEVPQQVAEMIKERLQSEGSIGREHRIDRDEAHLDALG